MKGSVTTSTLVSEIQSCLHLAIPLVGAQLAQSATSFVDTVMMGWLGSDTIAAGGLGAVMFNTLLLTSAALVSAVSPLTAEAFGAGNHQKVGSVVRQGFWLAVLLVMPCMVLLYQAQPILLALGQNPETVERSQIYVRAILWGIVPGLGIAVLRNWLAALAQPRPIIITVILGTVFNIVANYGLMFGKWGLPALGLAGIGWASCLSLWGMFFGLLTYSLIQPQLRHYRILHHLHRFAPRPFLELLRIGLPIGVLAGVEVGLFSMTTVLMGQLGTSTLAAHHIALQTASLTFMVPLGISLATTARVGQYLGQANGLGARLAGYTGITLAALFMSTMGILFWLAPETIVGLYLDLDNSANRDVVAIAKSLLGVAALFQIVDGIQICAAGALRGLKDTYVPMIIGIVAYWGVGLVSGYVLGFQMGLAGVGLWLGLAFGLMMAAIVLTWRFSVMPPLKYALFGDRTLTNSLPD
ncbi:MAG: MATE family efflux transporter [Synechococcales cyanobacterium T60_A2020_003]|nr:MATE family efflux transporter [Synechococcales cyanobacterium T60_A2020_003]